MIDNDDNDRHVTFIYLWSLTGETMPWLLQSQELGAAEVEAEVECGNGEEEVLFCSGHSSY